ncbi:hypothetical protein A9Q87_01275 [Flavobacteriales bacterium 34_180_T64]|nr:hypothetical protein A9Q87_01275 [Flavobacteriales bacterium 34_180_T64]
MRKFKQFMLLVMIGSLVTLTSCSNDDDSGDGGGGSAASGTLSAKVNGTTFQSMEISSSATVVSAGGVNTMVIIASNSDGNAFSFTIFGFDGAGTYKLTGADIAITNTGSYTETDIDVNNPINSTTEVWQAPYDDTEVGEIVVTEETATKVKGNFSFTCKNVNGDNSVKTITEGAFNLDKQS